MTTSFSRGISTWRFLRLCWRAPLILIVCAGILPRDVEPISQAQLPLFSSEIVLANRTRTYSLSVGESRGGGPRWNKRAIPRAQRLAAICVAPGELREVL